MIVCDLVVVIFSFPEYVADDKLLL